MPVVNSIEKTMANFSKKWKRRDTKQKRVTNNIMNDAFPIRSWKGQGTLTIL